MQKHNKNKRIFSRTKLERGERNNFSLYSLPTDSFFSEALFCSVFRWPTVPSTVGRHPARFLVSRLFSCLTAISCSLLAQRLWISDGLRPDPPDLSSRRVCTRDGLRPDPPDLSGRRVCTSPSWSVGDAVVGPPSIGSLDLVIDLVVGGG